MSLCSIKLRIVAKFFVWLSLILDRRRCSHQKNHDHGKPDQPLADYSAQIPHQAAPPRAPGIDNLFPGDELAVNRADDRSKKQTDEPKKQSDDRSDDCAD